ncbi:MAG TPA: MBL fold metallo-hydrolase [Anaerolineae bacterium]|nr:MBL fold metallo-hydrolase [Anaerolineae bacterium]
MTLTFLGVRGVFPTTQQMVSLHIKSNQGNLLLDAGSTNICNFKDAIETSNVLITHHHNDHIAMLPNFLIARFYEAKHNVKAQEKCLIVSPEPLTGFLHSMELEESEDFIHTTEVPTTLSGITLEYIVTKHPKKNFCYKLQWNDCTLVYTGDTCFFPELVDFCSNVDLLICEASYKDDSSDRADHWGHMIPKTVAKLINDSKPTSTILTHFVEIEGEDFSQAVVRHLGKDVDVRPAYEGLTIKL